MEIFGKIIFIGDTEQVTDKFKKRDFAIDYIEDNPQYKQQLKFELAQENVSKLDGLKVGDEVSVGYNLRGRETTSKDGKRLFFNSLAAWKITKQAAESDQGHAPVNNGSGDDEDGLPF